MFYLPLVACSSAVCLYYLSYHNPLKSLRSLHNTNAVGLTLWEDSLHPQMLHGQEIRKVYCLNICVEAGGVSAAPNPGAAPSLGETGKTEARDFFSSLIFAMVTTSWSLIKALQNPQRNKLTRLDTAAAKTKFYSTVMRIKITHELSQNLF